MLRISEQWYGSDVGRQRQGNEDNFFVRAPLYVVADGMGGAQAGEVASQLAVETFEPGLPDGAPDRGLVELIRAANARIHDMSRSDSQRSGMGTTCTAAYVDRDEVVIAHVGDSRAYLWRNGDLTRLTRDHSLVGELVDRGKLTEEEAELHPQRSVITRALGPEPDVNVDTERIATRDGDLFLLCSDGLTSMIRESQVAELIAASRSLEKAGRALIAAANEAGGRDNITVVLFRVEHVEVPGAETQATSEAPAVAAAEAAIRADGGGRPAAGDSAGGEARSARASSSAPGATRGREGRSGRDATVAGEPVGRSAPPPSQGQQAPTGEKRRRRRVPVGAFLVLFFAVVLVTSAFVAVRAVFFIGLDDRRAVTVYRGLPYELPLGIDLYSRHYISGVTIDQVPAARRPAFTDHKLRSLEDATDLVAQLETGRLRE